MGKAVWFFSLMFVASTVCASAQNIDEVAFSNKPVPLHQVEPAKTPEPSPPPPVENLPPGENPNAIRETSLGAVDAAVTGAAESRDERLLTKWTVLGSYSYFDLWVPSKVGVAAVYNHAVSDSFEIQFDRGSVGFDYFNISLGKVSDDRISLIWRRFNQRNSFNYFVGLHHTSYKIRLGDDLLKTVGATQRGAVEMMEISELGPTIGFGNRWQSKSGIVWSFDWLTLNFPLWTLKSRTPFLDSTSNSSAQKDVQDVLRVLKNVPTGAVVKIHLGYAF